VKDWERVAGNLHKAGWSFWAGSQLWMFKGESTIWSTEELDEVASLF
jgi:hypothetical protein